MALPPQGVEKLVREKSIASGSYRELLMLTGTLFFASILVYLGLTFGYKPYLKSQVGKLDAQIKSFGDKIPLADQKKIIEEYSQLVNLKKLLDTHVVTTPALAWFEAHTQTNVYYTQWNANVVSGQIVVTGAARTLADIGEQVAIFEQAPEVARINFSNVSLGANGLWQFT